MTMRTRFKIVAIAALWGLIAVAALSGWLIGHGFAAMQISESKRQLAESTPAKRAYGMQSGTNEARPANPFGVTVNGILPGAPQEPHLREMLTRH